MNQARVTRGLALLSATILVLGINVPRALAADADLTADLPTVPAHYENGWASVLAASGDDVLVAHEATYRWSGDGGQTWAPIGFPGGLTNLTDCGFWPASAGVATTDCLGSGLAAYSVVTNAQVGSTWSDSGWEYVLDARGSRALVDASSAYRVVDLAPTPATVTTLQPGEVGLKLTDDGVLVASTSFICPVNCNQGDGSWTLTVSVVTGSGSTTLKVITGPVADHPVSASGDYVYYDGGHYDADPYYRCYFHISDPTNGGCVNAGGTLPTPAADTGADNPYRVGGNAIPTLERHNSDGTWTTVSTLDWAADHVDAGPTQVRSLSLTPTTLLGWDHRQGGATTTDATAWTRSVGSSIGSESTIGTGVSGASSVASAARWVIPTGGSSNLGADCYDNGTKVRSDTGHRYEEYFPLQLSGPNLLLRYLLPNADQSQSVVENVTDGSRVSVTDPVGIFGSLVLMAADDSGRYEVKDVSGASATISGQLNDPGNDWNNAAGIWGDWVGFTTYETTGTDDDSAAAVVHNFRTGAEKSLSGYTLNALGDGFAVVTMQSDPYTSSVWNFATGATTTLAGSPVLAVGDGIDVAAIDGDRVAYSDVSAGKLHVQTFDGLARSAPRSLGVVAAGSFTPSAGQTWNVDIDLTKPVNAGQLQLMSASGSVVRSIPVAASATGSLRGITWDGKDDAGNPAPSGVYTFKLTSQASDGSGAVVAVDGTDRALGSVTVVGPTLVSATPVIGGTAVVGGTLTVTPGAWGPSGVNLAFQWLRDGQPIAAASATSYVAVAGDAGHDISIKVTGSYGGTSASATSAAVRVGTASFASAPAPMVSGTWFYGKTVTAAAGAWSPAPDSLGYQWLRDGQPISGAASATYTLGADDVGRQVSVRVTAVKAGYGTAQALSAGHVVGGTKFSKTGAASISGTAKVGKSLTGKLGKFTPKPAKVTYQWLRNGQPIAGATKSKYKLTKADKGTKVSIKITATKPGYYPVTKTSKAKKVK